MSARVVFVSKQLVWTVPYQCCVQNIAVLTLKLEQICLTAHVEKGLQTNDPDGMPNRVDSDQTAPCSLILVFTVCWNLSLQILLPLGPSLFKLGIIQYFCRFSKQEKEVETIPEAS